MIPDLPGTAIWAVLMTTHEVDWDHASATSRAQVLAVAASERVASDIALELVPYLPQDSGLAIQEATMIEPW